VTNNLCYPKPDLGDIYRIYEFEIDLMENILNGKTKEALDLYGNFLMRSLYVLLCKVTAKTNKQKITSLPDNK